MQADKRGAHLAAQVALLVAILPPTAPIQTSFSPLLSKKRHDISKFL